MDNIIEIKNLKKSFGDINAVDNISFDVERGSMFAFLGLNGAGKSTTINILCTLLQKDSGDVKIDGLDINSDAEEIKKRIGIVFQNSVLDARLSVKDNLEMRASYYGLRGEPLKKRITELNKMLSLEELLSRPYGKLSGGQRRRVDIARGLLNYPKLLFLDEPTTGLDPQTRQTIWKLIDEIRSKQNMTVFLTTHYMEEANAANNVIIIDSGKIVANGSPLNLKNKFSSDYIKLYSPKTENLDRIFIGANYQYRYEGESYNIKIKDSLEAKKFVIENNDIINDFEIIKGDMDDVFLSVTGKKLGGETN